MLCKNNQLYVSILLIHSFTNRMIWTNPSIWMTSLCKKKKDFNLPHTLQSNEKIYINTHTRSHTHNLLIKTSGTARGLILNHHIHLLWFTSHTFRFSLTCHTLYYIFTEKTLKRLVMCLEENRKANKPNRNTEEYTVNWYAGDAQQRLPLYKSSVV